jgi:hypothetical protein
VTGSAALRSAALCGILVTVAAGCGVPTDGDPVSVSQERVPYRLLSPSSPPSESPTAPSGTLVTRPQIFFVSPTGHLVASPQTLPATGLGTVEDALLERLTAGPTDADRALGLDTALGQGAELRFSRVEAGVASLEVTPGDPPPSAERLPLAVAQVVLTATSVAGVDSVILLRDGHPVDVPLPGGEQVAGPVTAEQYASLLSPRTAVTQAAPSPTSSSTATAPPAGS